MNHKLRLSIDDLSVESFHIAGSGVQDGTVRGHETGQWDVSCASCGGTCAGSCEGCPATGDCISDRCNEPNSWNDFSCRYTCQTCDEYTKDAQVTGG